MTMKRNAMFAAALIACANACAQDDAAKRSELWLDTGFATYHFQSDKNLNGRNPGIGVEYKFSESSALTAGRFYNSDRQHSNYAGMYYQPWNVGPVRLGAVVGGFNGYPKMREGGWFLALIPVATFEYKRVGVNIAVIPTYKERLHGGISMQLKFKLWE
jgi:hypothetical protein